MGPGQRSSRGTARSELARAVVSGCRGTSYGRPRRCCTVICAAMTRHGDGDAAVEHTESWRCADDDAEPASADIPAVGGYVNARELVAAQLPERFWGGYVGERRDAGSHRGKPPHCDRHLCGGEHVHDPAYADVTSAIDTARLPFLPDGPLVTGGGESGQGGGRGRQGRLGRGQAEKRGGRQGAVECSCQPPRKLHTTPKQIEDGPVICGLCREPFEIPEDGEEEEA